MRRGTGLARIAALLLVLTSGCATKALVVAPGTAPRPAEPTREATRKPPPTRLESASISELVLSIEDNRARVNGERVDVDNLTEAVAHRRGDATIARIVLGASYDELLLGRAIDAAARAKLDLLKVEEHDGKSVTTSLQRPPDQPELIGWIRERQLFFYDLAASASAPHLLGPFDPEDEASVRALNERLRACQSQPCLADLELTAADSDAGVRIISMLRFWARATDHVSGLTTRFSVNSRFGSGVNSPVQSGRLPPVLIQAIVRQNFTSIRSCYEAGLARDANLRGRVNVRFVIGRDGKVSHITHGDSKLSDERVVECTVRAFQALEFPPPERGIVTVVYPIIFDSE